MDPETIDKILRDNVDWQNAPLQTRALFCERWRSVIASHGTIIEAWYEKVALLTGDEKMMTLQTIDQYFEDLPSWQEADKAAQLEFARCCSNITYGPSQLQNAWHWWLEGWTRGYKYGEADSRVASVTGSVRAHRYVLFAGMFYYPTQGWNDWKASSEKLETLVGMGEEMLADDNTLVDWYHVIDLTDFSAVAENKRDEEDDDND